MAIGRPRALTPEQILMAEAMTADPAISTRQVAEQFGIHRSTLVRNAPLSVQNHTDLPDTLMREICMSGSMSGDWKRSHGEE